MSSTAKQREPMSAERFRESAMAAFPPEGAPAEVVSDLAREVHDDTEVMEKTLKGQPWTAIPESVLAERAKDIVALTVPAFVHYIPAFMCAAVRSPESESATYAMYALCPLGNYDTFYQNTCSQFTPDQAGLVAEFLKFLVDEPSFTLFSEEMKPGCELWNRRAQA